MQMALSYGEDCLEHKLVISHNKINKQRNVKYHDTV